MSTKNIESMSMEQQLAEALAENQRLKAQAGQVVVGGLTIRIGEKGGVTVYGLGRFPTTLYKEQWLRLLDFEPQIRKFIADNDTKLKAKPPKAPKVDGKVELTEEQEAEILARHAAKGQAVVQ